MFNKFIIFCTAVLVTQMTLGAVFIKFDGVDGESNDADHRAYSNALSWSWGSIADGKSVCVKDFNLIKEVDKSSPTLLMNQVTGKLYPTARVAVTTDFADQGRFEYITLDFVNVRMTSHSTTSNADNVPIENISISFDEVTYTYFELDQRGGVKSEVTATISSSSKC